MIVRELGRTGTAVAAIGQGCMGIGGELTADSARDEEYVSALQLGIDLGMTFIDTAEVYGHGHSEVIVGRAVKGRRTDVFIATKFSPEHNGYPDVLRAAERSLQRLGTDYLDLYQVHWPNPAIPVDDTMRALDRLVRDGKVRYCGVSNFSVSEMEAAASAVDGLQIVSNQLEYNLFDRTVEQRVLPHCLANGVTLIAYSPLDKGRVSTGDSVLEQIATSHRKTSAQVVLNWLIHRPGVIVIPKALNPAHLRENAAAADFTLTEEEHGEIDRVFTAEPTMVPVGRITVSVHGEGARKVYQTLDEALANALGFSPSPRQLADDILKGEPVKPVRLIRSALDPDGFDLIEGRIRYWAWTIAHGSDASIPALIRPST